MLCFFRSGGDLPDAPPGCGENKVTLPPHVTSPDMTCRVSPGRGRERDPGFQETFLRENATRRLAGRRMISYCFANYRGVKKQKRQAYFSITGKKFLGMTVGSM